MENFDAKDKEFLLDFARKAIEAYLTDKRELEIPEVEEKFQKTRGVFVSLHENSDLRGCLGVLESNKPLIEEIRDNAIEAATADPRFLPVTVAELPKIKIEISILTPPKLVKIEDIKPGIDGVTLKNSIYKATYLPQVWAHFDNNKEQFFSTLAQKAGLAASAYLDKKTEFYSYQAEVFSE